jgi:hypothetical protein
MSPRAAGASYKFIFRNSATPYDWLLMVFPQAFGALRTEIFGDGSSTELGSRLWEHSVYVGILPLALAGVAGWQGLGVVAKAVRRRAVDATAEVGLSRHQLVLAAYFACAVLGAFLFALGEYTPLSHLVYRTPVLGRFRDVERMMIVGDFALAALAAFALHILGAVEARRALGRRLAVIAGLALGLPVAIVALVSTPAVNARLREELVAFVRFDRANVLVPLGFCAVAAAALLWMRRWGAPPRARAAVVGLVALELGFYTVTFQPLAERDLFRKPPAVLQALQAKTGATTGEPFRKATFLKKNDLDNDAAKETLAVSWGMPFGIEDINGFNSLQPRRYTDYVFGTGEEDVSYGNLKDRKLLRAESPILSSLNVRYLLVPRALSPRLGANFEQVYESDEVRVYENHDVYPRAYFTDAWQASSDTPAVLAAVTADGFDGRRRALLEQVRGPLPPPPGPSDPASVTLGAWGATTQRLTATTAVPRVLLTSEMYFPGWEATIDGQPVPILRANYIFRAVVVPAGTHQIEFRYRPGSLRLGATVTALALAVAALLISWRRARATPAG